MNGSQELNQEQDHQERKKPTLIAYSVKRNEDQAIWTHIGAAWAHKKWPGFSIQLDAFILCGGLDPFRAIRNTGCAWPVSSSRRRNWSTR